MHNLCSDASTQPVRFHNILTVAVLPRCETSFRHLAHHLVCGSVASHRAESELLVPPARPGVCAWYAGLQRAAVRPSCRRVCVAQCAASRGRVRARALPPLLFTCYTLSDLPDYDRWMLTHLVRSHPEGASAGGSKCLSFSRRRRTRGSISDERQSHAERPQETQEGLHWGGGVENSC
jgi:hypothetical protein